MSFSVTGAPMIPRITSRLSSRTRLPKAGASGGIRCAIAGLSIALLAFGASALPAQTIRGTVVDETSKLPIAAVLVNMLDDDGKELPPGIRTDSTGNFVVHAARAGKWRVKAMRIGYTPIVSDAVELAVGSLTVVRLRMTTVAQQLVPVQIVERRQLNANELMSTAGFDLRASRGLGRFLGSERLAAMGQDGVREILGTFFQPALFVVNDPVLGEVIRIRQGANSCVPEVFLDGRLLATAPKPRAIADGPPPTSPLDSLRAIMREESDSVRVGFDQQRASSILSSLTAAMVHGIEVYRSYEVPPASLGAWFGMTKSAIKSCGTVAVWTKAGAQSVVTARRLEISGRAVQVVMGTLLDYDTGTPLAGRPVSLLSETRDLLGSPVVTNEQGEFSIRTGRAGKLRLTAGGNGYLQSTTAPFVVTANELTVVKLFVSARNGVLAPLGIAGRILPQDVVPSSLAGFTYRRERGQSGAFVRAVDIERMGAQSVADVLRAIKGVSIVDSPAPGTIVVAAEGARSVSEGGTNCKPVFYLDGFAIAENAAATIAALSVDRIFGIEVYVRPAEIPAAYADVRGCGLIVVWTKR